MPKSNSLRFEDWQSVIRLTGECRELGDDGSSWRGHLMAELSLLVDAELGMTGEMAGCRAKKPVSLGVLPWGWQTGFTRPEVFGIMFDAFKQNPHYCPTMIDGFHLLDHEPSACFGRGDIVDDRRWYSSFEYQFVQKAYGTDHILWSFQTINGPRPDENVGIVVSRAEGRRDFSGREKMIVRELTSALTPLVGGPLARFTEPSPSELTPRGRQVLRCLLEGDGDKQIATRLGIKPYTVNHHTKSIFRHFGVQSRHELMARWIRRGWGARFHWTEEATTGASPGSTPRPNPQPTPRPRAPGDGRR